MWGDVYKEEGGGNNARREKGGDGCIVLQIGMEIREKISIFVHYSTLILTFFLAIHNCPWFKRFIGLKIYFHRKMQK